MSGENWTKGPWKLDEWDDDSPDILKNHILINLDHANGKPCWDVAYVAANLLDGEASDEQLATARLIAAAPELYAALANICGDNIRRVEGNMFTIARAALAKARGEQP